MGALSPAFREDKGRHNFLPAGFLLAFPNPNHLLLVTHLCNCSLREHTVALLVVGLTRLIRELPGCWGQEACSRMSLVPGTLSSVLWSILIKPSGLRVQRPG